MRRIRVVLPESVGPSRTFIEPVCRSSETSAMWTSSPRFRPMRSSTRLTGGGPRCRSVVERPCISLPGAAPWPALVHPTHGRYVEGGRRSKRIKRRSERKQSRRGPPGPGVSPGRETAMLRAPSATSGGHAMSSIRDSGRASGRPSVATADDGVAPGPADAGGDASAGSPRCCGRRTTPGACRSAPPRSGRTIRCCARRHRSSAPNSMARGAPSTLPLDLHGTAFQRRVWAELLLIPFGETRSYGADRPRARRPEPDARGRRRQRPQPDLHRGALPPRGRRGGPAHGVRGRARGQAPSCWRWRVSGRGRACSVDLVPCVRMAHGLSQFAHTVELALGAGSL